MMELSERLQQLRKQAGYSQEQLAEKLEISRQAVSKWESGQTNPDIVNLSKLSALYHVSADYILTGEEWGTDRQEPEPLLQRPRLGKTGRFLLVLFAMMAALTVCAVFFLTAMVFILERI